MINQSPNLSWLNWHDDEIGDIHVHCSECGNELKIVNARYSSALEIFAQPCHRCVESEAESVSEDVIAELKGEISDLETELDEHTRDPFR